MGRIEELAERYERHITAPWVRNVAGAQKVIFLVYDKMDERRVRAKKKLFEIATRRGDHEWREIDLTDAFAEWMASDEYREAYFESPEDLTKASPRNENAEFTLHTAELVRGALAEQGEDDVLAVFGVAALFGFTRVSHILKRIEGDIRGRLVLFFPGAFEENKNFRLLDARDGWNYLAVPITAHDGGPRA